MVKKGTATGVAPLRTVGGMHSEMKMPRMARTGVEAVRSRHVLRLACRNSQFFSLLH